MSSQWMVVPGFHENAVDEHFQTAGIPVIVHSAGRYPELVNEHGESTRDVAHFVIRYSASHNQQGDVRTTTYRSIEVIGKTRSDTGASQQLTLWHRDLPNTNDIAPYIEEAKQHLDIDRLHDIPRRYAVAQARIDAAHSYPYELARDAYEAACKAEGVDILPDEQCRGEGHFTFPHYSADIVLARLLADSRWRGKLKEAEADKPQAAPSQTDPEIPAPNGQLWEPCEYCGKEPIYMPLHICLDCWPKCSQHMPLGH